MWPFRASGAETRGSANIENPTVPVSAENFLTFFGVDTKVFPRVSIDVALTVPAVNAAVSFLSRTMAALPLHAYRRTKDGAPQKISGKIESVLHDAPNPFMDSFKFRQYFWQQVFTGGRGLAWIERTPQGVEAIWAMDPAYTVLRRVGHGVVYVFTDYMTGRTIEYPPEDVIDVPYMLRSNGFNHFGPVELASKAIQLALSMNDYGSNFFAGGGVPPLALRGPLPAGADAMNRTLADINRAIDTAKASGKPITPIPGGYELTPVGIDPAKGQMVEARLFQIQEIARAWQIPPTFLMDLSHATFSNAEQQDLQLVKHLVGQWAQALEGEMNLKIFGRGNTSRYCEHNLDGLLRGDFLSRTTAYASAIQNAVRTPNEVRGLENLPPLPGGNDLLIQGATVPLVAQEKAPVPDATDAADAQDAPAADANQEDGAPAA